MADWANDVQKEDKMADRRGTSNTKKYGREDNKGRPKVRKMAVELGTFDSKSKWRIEQGTSDGH